MSAPPLFNFVLRPVDRVQPWGEPPHLGLHWFGLSDGWFWLELGGQQVFRACGTPREADLPYVDYQVVRLWEDLLEVLPAVLEPVPADIAAVCARDMPAWQERVECALRAGAAWTEEGDASATHWWNERTLDTGYLVGAPAVSFWRVEDQIHIAWTSYPEGLKHWVPVEGATTISLETFLLAVRSFDERFLGQMRARVQAVVSAGGVVGVEIDLKQLQQEQAERSTWLQAALAPSSLRHGRQERTDWEAVRIALSGSRT